MCGIVGIINHHGIHEAETIIHAMNDSLRYRGPDDDGFFIDDDVAFGHRRLAVISPETGHQPIFNEGGTVIAILNGEIYNHLELRRELEKKGHRFTTESDTETLVHLYEELGDSMVSRLEGMFAFAIYNRRNHHLLLARDRLGQKPLFYFISHDTLVFASELSGLLVHPAMEKELDMAAVNDYLSLLYIPEPKTIYRHVRRLPPGCTMTFSIDDPQPVIQPYWWLDFSHKNLGINFQDATKEVRRLVENAVRKRMVADVPLGVFLSGGLDSAIIAAVAAKIRAPEACDAYTIGFADASYDERAAARATTAAISRLPGVNLRHHELEVAPADFDLLRKLIRHFGQPFADASMLPTFLLSQFTRTGLTVALSGDGADEIFGGYERYIAMRMFHSAQRLPPPTQVIYKVFAAILPDSGERTFCGRLRRLCRLLANRQENAYFSLLDHCPIQLRNNLLGPRLCDIANNDCTLPFAEIEKSLTATDFTERCSELDIHTYMPGDVLTKVDIASMACALEVRSPFLDHELAEFAAALPWDFKLHGNDRKHILKAAFADLLPQEILNRRKRGFGVPLAAWLRTTWRKQAEEALFDGPLFSEGFIERVPLLKIWNDHQSARSDNSYLLWTLLMLSLFLENIQTVSRHLCSLPHSNVPS